MKSLGIEKMKNFSLAALLVAGTSTFTACSSDNDAIDEQPVKYTMTVNASKGEDAALTRALSLSGSTLTPTWSTADKVLVYQGETKLGELTATASNTSGTTLSGTLTAAPTADLTFYYHKKENTGYSGQDGTLATIALLYDNYEPVTVAFNDISINGNNFSVSNINFNTPQQAIAQFTFLDKADGTTLLSPSKLTMTVDIPAIYKTVLQFYNPDMYNELIKYLPYETVLNIPTSTYSASNGGSGIIFLAIPDKVSAMSAENQLIANNIETVKTNITFALTATVGSDTYELTKNGFPFENGNYYEITAKMTKQ